jgi:hypothetical protein
MSLRLYYGHPTSQPDEGPFLYCKEHYSDGLWRCVGFPGGDSVLFEPPKAWSMCGI